MPYPGASRREINHAKNESERFIKQKAKFAREQAIARKKAERRAKRTLAKKLRDEAKRRQRNNRREW